MTVTVCLSNGAVVLCASSLLGVHTRSCRYTTALGKARDVFDCLLRECGKSLGSTGVYVSTSDDFCEFAGKCQG